MSHNTTPPEQLTENLRDLVEPADAKSKATQPRKRPFPAATAPPKRETYKDNIFQHFIAARTLGFTPTARRQDFLITYASLEDYFEQLHVDLIDLIFPTQPVPPNIITQDLFVRVCKWLVCMRIQYVQRRNYNIIPRYTKVEYRPTFLVPTPLARVLKGLGSCSKMHGAIECAPSIGQARAFTPEELRQIELDPQSHESVALRAAIIGDPDEAVKAVTADEIMQFTRFVALMHRRGTSFVESLGDDAESRCPWYLHGVLRNNIDVANNVSAVTVVTFDTTPSPEEVLIAAIVQRRFNGAIANGPGIVMETDPITNVLGLRTTFNTAC